MAIWQFDFWIIPNKKILEQCDVCEIVKRDLQAWDDNADNMRHDMSIELDDILLWDEQSISKTSIKGIVRLIKRTKSWSDDIEQYGRDDCTCVQFFHKNNKLNQISVRLDLRSLTTEILTGITNFIKDNNALILTPKGVLLHPDMSTFISEVKKSDAYAFVRNSYGFLEPLKK